MKKFIEFLKKAWALIWSRDTLAHGGCCAAVSLAIFVILATPVWELPIAVAVIGGLIIGMLVGLVAEAVQSLIYKNYSWAEGKKDLIRDAIGCVLSLVPEFINIFN